MENVCTLFEFRVFRLQGKWHVHCGFPLKEFETKREAVSWCMRARRSFVTGIAARITESGEVESTPEYAAVVTLKQILMLVE